MIRLRRFAAWSKQHPEALVVFMTLVLAMIVSAVRGNFDAVAAFGVALVMTVLYLRQFQARTEERERLIQEAAFWQRMWDRACTRKRIQVPPVAQQPARYLRELR